MKYFTYFALFMGCFAISNDAGGVPVDQTTPVPIATLIQNVSRYVQQNPNDPHGYYTLGRLHSYAFAKGNIEEPLEGTFVLERNRFNSKERKHYSEAAAIPDFAPWKSIFVQNDSKSKDFTTQQRYHFMQSIKNYYVSTRMNPDRALYFLGLAWMLEQGAPHAETFGWPPLYIDLEESHKIHHSDYYHSSLERILQGNEVSRDWTFNHVSQMFYCLFIDWNELHEDQKDELKELLEHIWKELALNMYRRAYSLSIYREVKVKYNLHQPQGQIGVEAGQAIIRLLKERTPTPEYDWEVETIEKAIKIANSGMNIISPIVFSLTPTESLAELLSEHTVQFDLDGFGKATWPWVKSDTAILVWDPERKGVITSGKQLFGSVTWWMFWRDGYEALAALDDNDDGWLEVREMDGLAVWQDTNQNGISEAGEVTPIAQTEIERIAVRPSVRQNRYVECREGILLRSGAILPTYDWFPQKSLQE